MKERQILFQTEMIQPIPTGLKEQTRRTNNLDVINKEPDKWKLDKLYTYKGETWALFYKETDRKGKEIRCPYGMPGDLLWVREKWQYSGDQNWRDAMFNDWNDVWYYAIADEHAKEQLRWKPSIHMPKRFTRIWLENKKVRVERLWDISEKDAVKEGCETIKNGAFYKDYLNNGHFINAQSSFYSLWRKINGQQSWFSNPWVWVIDFRLTEHPNQQPVTSNQNQQP